MPLPHRTPEVGALDLFVSVVELGSVSAAAASHGISQPSATNRLHHLEDVLGVPLLERGPRGSAPTDAGALVAEWARPVLAAAAELSAAAAALRSTASRKIRIAASYTVAEYLLPAWLSRFGATTGAAVELEVVNSARTIERVRTNAADVGFIESLDAPTGLSNRTVARDELVVVVGKGHPWTQRRRPLTARMLATTQLILRERGSGTRDAFEQAIRTAVGATIEPVLELGSTASVKAAVTAGQGATVVSHLAVADERARGTLVAIPVDGLQLHRELRAVWKPGRETTQPLRAFLHQLATTTPAPM